MGEGVVPHLGIDTFHDAIDVVEDVVIPKTQDAEILACEPARSALVILYLFWFDVRAAIDLYNQSRAETDEVSPIRS